VPLLESRILNSCRQTPQIQRLIALLHIQLCPLVENRYPLPSIHSHCHILPGGQQLYLVDPSVVDLLVAEHRRDWVVANIVADPDPTSEDLGGDVLVEALVEDDPLGLTGGQD